MSKVRIDHVAIMASAGSGKTYQLALRYIKLLAVGCTPGQICAMTFSRKAAGEIFDAIVENLCKAAETDGAAERMAGQIGMPGMVRDDFLRLLRVLLDNLQHGHISTLDSFTVSIIRAFPMELGTSTELELMDNNGSAARLTRFQILSRVFNHRLVGPEVQRHFHEGFKEATFGREESDMVKPLDGFIKDYWRRLRAVPDVSGWGNSDRIWPAGSSLLSVSSTDEARAKLVDLIKKREFGHKGIAQNLINLADKMAGHELGAVWDKNMAKGKVFQALLVEEDLAGKDRMDMALYSKDFSFNAEECRLWSVLLSHCLGVELKKALQETAGIGRILDQYRLQYEPVMRSGRMTFEDAQYLLTSANDLSQGSHLSRDPGARLYIDYRLNCQLDHWLLDEFQDTSDLQWEVVSNLIDEVMQDDSGRKKFFFVGDVKQAIHGWRGGNARLFTRILDSYGSSIERVPLHVSFRSCQPVIDMVNDVFRELPATVSQSVRERWHGKDGEEGLWREHECAEGHVPHDGYAALLEAPATGDNGKCTAEDRHRIVGQILRETDPVSRGLSVAILVRGHKEGKALVEQLRRDCEGMPICHEGRAQILDNPVVAVLLSLIKFAAHPGDTLAWQHLLMSPLGIYIDEKDLRQSSLAYQLAHSIQEEGFENLVREWGARLNLAEDDNFGRKRVDDLAAAAAIFDQGGSRKCSDFLHFIDGHEIEETGTKASINVMTIHKSKGIGRDIVIVPDLERAPNESIEFAHGESGDSGMWALKMPIKAVVDGDERLTSIRREGVQEDEFEQLCVLYVALTRAKCANYIITAPDSAPKSSAGILRNRLKMEPAPDLFAAGGEEVKCLYEKGTRNWFEAHAAGEQGEASFPAELTPKFASRKSMRPFHPHREPSKHRGQTRSVIGLFEREDADVMEFGSAIHELLEKVQWIDETDIDAIIAEWEPLSTYDAEVTRDVIEQFRLCAGSAVVSQYLSKPDGDVDLWIEKRFEVLLDGNLVSGAFDRVTILRDSSGNAAEAVILDYKSSRSGDLERRANDYKPQMDTYREALAKILDIDEQKIECVLLFTRQQEVKSV